MASWKNVKWDGNKTLDELSYRDTIKLGLPSNIYGNLVYIDDMQATLNMAKRHMDVSKGTSPGASAIARIPFMAV